MKLKSILTLSILALTSQIILANEIMVGSKNPDELFTSKNPKLHSNKQVVYHIVKDLLEANQWSEAYKYISNEYIQHNPNAESGLNNVVKFFTEVLKVKPTPIPNKITKSKIISVTAEGDLVTVAYVREVTDEKNPANKYTTTWFDMWRIKDGKAQEHWDPATLLGK
jgi:predicted SnoaL-like aldol condensation-catalyzing enzyme